jgi:putrescine:ornithine antiporter
LWLTTVANFGGPTITGRIGSVTVWGVILPVGFLSIFGWFWFHGETFATAWNPKGLTLLQGMGSSIALTLWAFSAWNRPRRTRGGREPEAERAACMHVRHARRRVHLHPVNDRHPGDRAERGAREIDRPIRARLRAHVQSDDRIDRDGARGDGVSRFASRLAVHDRANREVAADQRMFPALFSYVNRLGAPLIGMVVMGVAQSLLALSTISPSLSEQFAVLVNLAVVTNVVPYVIALSALPIMMQNAGVSGRPYRRTIAIAVVAMAYSVYAIYASGKDAVFGGMIVTGIGYVIWGFIASRFAESKPVALRPAA